MIVELFRRYTYKITEYYLLSFRVLFYFSGGHKKERRKKIFFSYRVNNDE